MAINARRRSRKGTSLDPEDRDFVLQRMAKPEGEKASTWLARTRFRTTQYGKVDRRCKSPLSFDADKQSTHRRQNLGQIRALARAIVIEIKRAREAETT
jgi:hypothetical protein